MPTEVSMSLVEAGRPNISLSLVAPTHLVLRQCWTLCTLHSPFCLSRFLGVSRCLQNQPSPSRRRRPYVTCSKCPSSNKFLSISISSPMFGRCRLSTCRTFVYFLKALFMLLLNNMLPNPDLSHAELCLLCWSSVLARLALPLQRRLDVKYLCLAMAPCHSPFWSTMGSFLI